MVCCLVSAILIFAEAFLAHVPVISHIFGLKIFLSLSLVSAEFFQKINFFSQLSILNKNGKNF